MSDNKSIFSHCVDKQYICSITGCASRLSQSYSQHYADNVPIIGLGAAVKTSVNKDEVSKDNLFPNTGEITISPDMV